MNPPLLTELSIEQLDRWKPDASNALGHQAGLACLLEAAAIKAGNVHPYASFSDMCFDDFRRSALLLEPIIESMAGCRVGQLLYAMVEATQSGVGKNTNLGILLLFGPMIVALRANDCHARPVERRRFREWVGGTLSALNAQDASLVYEAIRLVNPGGLGKVETMDVNGEAQPTTSLLAAMEVAAERDDIARQYINGYADVFLLADRLDTLRSEWTGWLPAIAWLQVERLAEAGDSLIGRKNGPDEVARTRQLAERVLRSAEPVALDKRQTWIELDRYLRGDGHRRNPGTTADLLAAAILVCLVSSQDRSPPNS